ncbi:hypothetical protein EW146_g6519 [Bondarzewia mesenterica]|uniref:Inositol-3-phosphate synthase n=1 Tax=Bondarzewia mesenterica TaxID=1095465 RepID=A0A4S4LNY8_9AGAM|nr:hypothetical protein EW146_g6519 [Bondarzewia mesenterica]
MSAPRLLRPPRASHQMSIPEKVRNAIISLHALQKNMTSTGFVMSGSYRWSADVGDDWKRYVLSLQYGERSRYLESLVVTSRGHAVKGDGERNIIRVLARLRQVREWCDSAAFRKGPRLGFSEYINRPSVLANILHPSFLLPCPSLQQIVPQRIPTVFIVSTFFSAAVDFSSSSTPTPIACTRTSWAAHTTHTEERSTPPLLLFYLSDSLLARRPSQLTHLNKLARPHLSYTYTYGTQHLPFVWGQNTVYTDEFITSKFENRGADVVQKDGRYVVQPTVKPYEFRTQRKVPKTGLMLVGMGGNNGTTLIATILANRHNIAWHNKSSVQQPNYVGSLLRASTIRLGLNPTTGKDIHAPLCELLPMVHPNDLVVGGWDISGVRLDNAMARAAVLEWDLQRQVAPYMKEMGSPLPSIYYPDYIAANQAERADNVLPGEDKQVHLEQIRKDIREFKLKNGLDQVIVFWTANTERYSDIVPGVNDSADAILNAIKTSHAEVAPSTVFAVASILEGVPFINGAPQNTFVPGVVALAEKRGSFIGGDDLKSGQTKLKSVLAEFLVNAGIKPLSIASYNHLGNNDGWNLSSDRQFKSKEISKSSVVDDMVAANNLLYKSAEEVAAESGATGKDGKVVKGEHPDHIVVIKYVPAVGDSKRAIDEYYSEIMGGGRSTISIFNECEDSLLATPLILDLTILAELLTRISYRDVASGAAEFKPLYPVLSLLSYMLKAPLVKPGTDVVNSLSRQRNALETFLKACIGLEGSNDLLLESRIW